MSFVSFNFRVVLMPDDANPSKFIDPGPIAPTILKWIKTYVDLTDTENVVTGFTVKYDATSNRFKASLVFSSPTTTDPIPTVDDIVKYTQYADAKIMVDNRPYAVHCKDLVFDTPSVTT